MSDFLSRTSIERQLLWITRCHEWQDLRHRTQESRILDLPRKLVFASKIPWFMVLLHHFPIVPVWIIFEAIDGR